MTKGRVLFVIPARGGSKGVKRKNLRTLAGIPLVGWAARSAVRAAASLGVPSRVVCSTDDPEIAAVARSYGAEVPFERPHDLAGDSASSESVVVHALDHFEAQGERFDAVVRLQPTAPLTAPEDIRACVELFFSGDRSNVTTVVPGRPPSWTYRIDAGRLVELLPEPPGVVRRQDLPDYFALNGAVTVASPSSLRASAQLIAAGHRTHVVPAERGIDVDSEADLLACESLLRARVPRLVSLAGRYLRDGARAFVIAEAGVNHNGDLALAKRLVAAAAAAGADAVKFQTWITAKLLTPEAPLAAYQERNTGGGLTQFEMIKRLELPLSAWPELQTAAAEAGILLLSTPDEEDSADMLEALGVPAFKIGSAEVTNVEFLQHVARKGRPVILSTGMSTLPEVDAAVRAIEATGLDQLVLLQCVSDYPSAAADANLRAMDTLRQAFGYPVGLSDHSLGHTVAVAAVARGACVIEKHLTLDTRMEGPDHAASLDPAGFEAMVTALRTAEAALGDGDKRPTASEMAHRPLMRKRWVASRDLAAGTRLTRADLLLRRSTPDGLDPAELGVLLGRELRHAVSAYQAVTLEKLR